MTLKRLSHLFFPTIFFCMLLQQALSATDILQIPVAYQGRFHPLDVYAKLWINELYHHQSIKSIHRKAFDSINGSATDLLLKMNFLGHQPWDNAPLFWIHFAKTKELLGINLDQDHFSYRELHHAILENSETRLQFVRHLILYHFFKALKESAQPLQKVELTSLAKGLWLALRNNDVIVLAAPKFPPWDHLKSGMILTSEGNQLPNNFVEKKRQSAEELINLLAVLQLYLPVRPPGTSHEELKKMVSSLSHLTPQQIATAVEEAHPLKERLIRASPLFPVLPSKSGRGEWLPLNALAEQIYDAKQQDFVLAPNFTLYSDALFQQLREKFFELNKRITDSASEGAIRNAANDLAAVLLEGYRSLEGTFYQKGSANGLKYPSLMQLSLEQVYYRYPLIPFALFLYGASCLCFCLAFWQKSRSFEIAGTGIAFTALMVHTLILGLRCYILQRPPVSNMFETVIYVPWVGMMIGFLLRTLLNSGFILPISCLGSLILLAVLQATHIDQKLENVQAVLNSQYWLIIHVMLVVGSYGAFVLSGLLGHIYLIIPFISANRMASLSSLPNLILQTMYIGVAMLTAGTILGGVWAAESWGRFWDWDPKESWAFISICIYLIWIHAYNFRIIHDFGLAIGSVVGLAAISFTWYGVNYILGTGLHSYGFGNGGEIYYFIYLFGEALFTGFATLKKTSSLNKEKS